MKNQSLKSITSLVHHWTKGDQQAFDKLIALVYTELNRKGHALIQQERAGRTLQTSDLVHETYLRLLELGKIHWQDEKHFFTVVAGVMRRILVDHARAHNAFKRGRDWHRVTMDENQLSDNDQQINVDLLALDQALERLSNKDAIQARVVELRYFAGITIEEIAETLGISSATVKRKWVMARSRLYHDLYSVAA